RSRIPPPRLIKRRLARRPTTKPATTRATTARATSKATTRTATTSPIGARSAFWGPSGMTGLARYRRMYTSGRFALLALSFRAAGIAARYARRGRALLLAARGLLGQGRFHLD